MPNVKSKGFTLIEVLVASIILFIFVAMAAQIFRQSAVSSLKAERAVKVAAVVPLVVENIRSKIMDAKDLSDVSGQGRLQEVEYIWRASLAQRLPPIEGFDPRTEEFRTFEDKYSLWNVDITIVIGNYERHWVYEELTWYEPPKTQL